MNTLMVVLIINSNWIHLKLFCFAYSPWKIWILSPYYLKWLIYATLFLGADWRFQRELCFTISRYWPEYKSSSTTNQEDYAHRSCFQIFYSYLGIFVLDRIHHPCPHWRQNHWENLSTRWSCIGRLQIRSFWVIGEFKL